MAEASPVGANTKASIGTTDDAVSIQAGHHVLVADGHAALGGKDAGPARFTDVAERTPATLAIKGGVPIKTELRRARRSRERPAGLSA